MKGLPPLMKCQWRRGAWRSGELVCAPGPILSLRESPSLRVTVEWVMGNLDVLKTNGQNLHISGTPDWWSPIRHVPLVPGEITWGWKWRCREGNVTETHLFSIPPKVFYPTRGGSATLFCTVSPAGWVSADWGSLLPNGSQWWCFSKSVGDPGSTFACHHFWWEPPTFPEQMMHWPLVKLRTLRILSQSHQEIGRYDLGTLGYRWALWEWLPVLLQYSTSALPLPTSSSL